MLEETDLNGTLTNEYIFFGGERTARYNPTSGYTFYFSDHLGSADVVTDALGNIKEESDYYPFGGERIVTDLGIGNNYKFSGKERDPETGCDYFGARYYCNPIGRFITPDWAATATAVPYANFGNPQSLNLYSYVKNNPTTFGDPDGHCGWCSKLKNLFLSDQGCWCTNEQIRQKEVAWLNEHFPGQGYRVGNLVVPFDQLDPETLRQAYNYGLSDWWNANSKRIDPFDPNQAIVLVPSVTRMLLNSKVQDPKLRNLIDNYYREKSSFGDGGTADAIEYERATGQPIGGKFHTQKGIELSNGLRNLINSGKLSPSDAAIAQRLLDRLTQALTYTK